MYDKGTASAVDKSFDHEDQANKLHKQVNQRDASMDRAAAKLGNKFRKGVGEQWEPVSGYDTVYPRAEVIKNKNGKPIGEIYQDTYGWGCFHYKADNGADGMSNREEALEQLKDMHNEHRQQGVAEGENFATFEDIHSLTKLAGIPVAESRLMDATGETIDHILDRFKYEVRNFEATDDLDDDLYDALSDYYSNKGDMPYRIMRMSGRTDDPYEWVSDQLAKHLGIKGVAREGVLGTVGGAMLGSVMGPVGAAVGGVAGQEMTKGGSGIVEGSCNQTMEGEYCPEHGLMECGMAEGADDTNMGVLGKMVGAGIPKPSDFAAGFNKTFESRESDVLLARIKSLALIR